MANVFLRAAIFAVAAVMCAPAATYAVDPAPLLVESDVSRVWTCGSYVVGLLGQNIQQGATIKLVKSGQADIIATGVKILKGANWTNSAIKCKFNVSSGTAGGMWSIQLTNPDSQVSTLVNVIEVVPNCPKGAAGDLYVANTFMNNVLQFDGETGEFVCIFADTGFGMPGRNPNDLIWAPNGNLWVVVNTPFNGTSTIREYDGQTGAFIRVVSPDVAFSAYVNTVTFSSEERDFYTIESTSSQNSTQVCRQYNSAGANPQYLGIALDPTPIPMYGPFEGRMTSNNHYLIAGNAVGFGPVITLGEFDQDWNMLNAVVDKWTKQGLLESVDGNSYFVSIVDSATAGFFISRYDAATLSYIDTPIPSSSCMNENTCGAVPPNSSPDPACCYYKAMRNPYDIARGPNGLLYVMANQTYVPMIGGHVTSWYGAIHVFNPTTGQQVKVVGRQVLYDSSVGGGDLQFERIKQAAHMEFKPLPGDYSSSGGTFQGNGHIDEADLTKFVENLSEQGNPSNNPHALLSFDFNRDGDIDCADWPPFAAAFLASSGYAPSPPLPTIEDFVTALLGTNGQSCFTDRNGDGTVDGLDVQPFVNQFLQP